MSSNMYPSSDMEKLSHEQLLQQPYDPPPPYNTWQPSAPPSTAAQQPQVIVSPTGIITTILLRVKLFFNRLWFFN